MTRKLFIPIMIAIAIALSGCQSAFVQNLLPGAYKAGGVAVNMANLAVSLGEFETEYRALRTQIEGQKEKFSPDDWAQLLSVNTKFTQARVYVSALRDMSNGGESMLLNLRQIAGIVRPVQQAGEMGQKVLDKNIDLLSPESRADYLAASRKFSEVNGVINDVLADPDAEQQVERLKRLATAGAVLFRVVSAAKFLI